MSQIFLENFIGSISSREDHYRRIKSFKKHCRVVRRGKVRRANRKKNEERLSKVDGFNNDLIRASVYEFYDQKICPTLDMLSEKIRVKTKSEDYEFSYCKTWLWKRVKSLGVRYCRSNNIEVFMESSCIMDWRWEFLREIRKW